MYGSNVGMCTSMLWMSSKNRRSLILMKAWIATGSHAIQSQAQWCKSEWQLPFWQSRNPSPKCGRIYIHVHVCVVASSQMANGTVLFNYTRIPPRLPVPTSSSLNRWLRDRQPCMLPWTSFSPSTGPMELTAWPRNANKEQSIIPWVRDRRGSNLSTVRGV